MKALSLLLTERRGRVRIWGEFGYSLEYGPLYALSSSGDGHLPEGQRERFSLRLDACPGLFLSYHPFSAAGKGVKPQAHPRKGGKTQGPLGGCRRLARVPGQTRCHHCDW